MKSTFAPHYYKKFPFRLNELRRCAIRQAQRILLEECHKTGILLRRILNE